MSAVFSGYDGCLKMRVGSTLDILLLFYDMITKCANKPKTGRKQTRAGSTPTYSLGGRVDEQSLTFRDLEKSGGLKKW